MGVVQDGFKIAKDVVKEVKNLKKTDNVLMRTRDKVLALFKTAGDIGEKAALKALKDNKLAHADIANQKIGGSYDAEFQRLWKMVADSFNNMGRADLSTSFQRTIPVYTENKHDVSFIGTLLNGAGSSKPTIITNTVTGPNGQKNTTTLIPSSTAAANNDYRVLLPFKGVMQDALVSQGHSAPTGMEDLSQLFYNKFVAQEPMNFFDMSPEDTYHLDQGIIEAIVGYFKSLADRKKRGEVLPKVQDKIADVTLQTEAGLQAAAKNEVAKEIGATVMTTKTMIVIAVILVAAIIGGYAILKG